MNFEQGIKPRFMKPRKETSNPTPYLYVSGVLPNYLRNIDVLRSYFSKFGELDDSEGPAVESYPDKVYKAFVF